MTEKEKFEKLIQLLYIKPSYRFKQIEEAKTNDRNYDMVLYSDVYIDSNSEEKLEWSAEYPDIFGLVGAGDTKEGAIKEAEIAKNQYLDYLEEINQPFPVKKRIIGGEPNED